MIDMEQVKAKNFGVGDEVYTRLAPGESKTLRTILAPRNGRLAVEKEKEAFLDIEYCL